MKKCKFCYGDINEKATVCSHCGRKQSTLGKTIVITSICSILFFGFILILFIYYFKDDYQNFENISDFKRIFEKGNLVCTNTTTDEDGLKTFTTIEFEYSFGRVESTKQVDIIDTENGMADFYVGFAEMIAEAFNEVDGIYVEYSKLSNSSVKSVWELYYNELDYKKLEEIQKKLDEDYSSEEKEQDLLDSSRDIKIVKKQYTKKGYVCK